MPDNFLFEMPLDQADAEANRMIMLERRRQAQKLILIASESICPKPVRQAVAGELANIYAEGYPSTRMSVWERDDIGDIDRHLAFFRRYADRRYYKGTEFCDFIETLAQQRAAQLFTRYNARGVRADDLRVNVQPLSGAAANNAIYNATVQPGDTIMGIELAHGGHLSHGSPFNRSGQVYNVVAYHTNPKTGTIDYDEVIDLAKKHKPKIIVCGGSALPWPLDFEALRKAADSCGAILHADMAHPAGLIVAGEYPNPIGLADIVMTTTHKTLCGPRGAIILTTNERLAEKIDMGVFPGEQGGPHMNSIAGKAVAFGLALRDEFVTLMKNVRSNAKAFADELVKQGFNLVGGGTDSHLFLLDCKKFPGVKGNVNGDIASRVLDLVGITLNKNTVAGDTSAANPSGLRIGTTWISQLGFTEASTRELAQVMADVLKSMRPFDVLGAFGYLGRARLPLEVMQSARQRISGLIARHPWPEIQARVRTEEALLFGSEDNALADPPADFGHADTELAAAKETAALIDVTRAGLFEVRGERALHFLQLLSTADLSQLEAGQGADTFFLDSDGRMIAPATVWRDSQWERQRSTGWQRRYWVQVPGATRAAVAEWFRGHTDGYMLFTEDLHAKIDGPVVVIDRRERLSSQVGAPALHSFALVGPTSQAVLQKALPDAPAMAANTCRGIAGTSIGLTRGGFGGNDSIELHVVGADALEVWKKLVDAGATAAGLTTTAALYGRTGLPAPGTPVTELRNNEKFADKFQTTSTYFVGSSAAITAEGKTALPAFAWTDHDEHDESKLKKSCLYNEHIALKGVMVPFAGWSMPVKYSGAISEEHKAVRTKCGLFDVSHMGVFEFRGAGAQRFLDQVTSNYVSKLRKGEAHYSYLLDAAGGCIDDIFVYCRDFDRYMMVVNAANADKDWDWINGLNEGRYAIDPARPWVRPDGGVTIVNLKEDEREGDRRRVDLALQGKTSYKVLRSMADRVTAKAITDLARTHFMECTLEGIDVIIAKTGYTGEAVGCELYVHPDRAPEFWKKLLARRDDFGIEAVGLGARDSTRTEAGFPLYGHELAGPYGINATEAGYGSFVKRHKPFFAGRAGFLAAESKRTMEVVRFRMTHGGVRTIPTGATVVNKKGQGIGFVTSAALVGDRQIGLAWVKRQFVDEGMRIGVFIPPRKPEGAAKHGYELAVGDNMAIHEEATILSRFPKKGEFNANIGL
ncbi:MAG: serine hydroxymethyltransferase [Planctomycetota bacterium]